MKRNFVISVIFVVCMLLIVVSCAPASEAPASEAPASEAPAAEEKKDIVLAGTVLQEDQFSMLLMKSYQDTAKEMGVEILTANVQNSADKEVELVNTYIERGVDGIIIEPCAAEASIPIMQKAHDAGIPVLVCAIEAEGADFPIASIVNDPHDLGWQTGQKFKEYAEKNFTGKIKIAIVEFKSQLPVLSDARVQGFIDAIEGMDYEIVSRQDAWLPEMAVSKVGDVLTANKDIDVFFCANEGGTVGTVMAVKSAGLSIPVFGTDGGVQLSNMLLDEDNILQATTTQVPAELGVLAVEAMMKYLNGETLGEEYKQMRVPGALLSRDDPDFIKKHMEEWQAAAQ